MSKPFCDGLTRRDAVRLGTAAVFGAPITLSHWLRADVPNVKTGDGVSVIFVFLHGGMSTIDTFDLKPDAPQEIRGPFDPIATTVPGIQICEHLPKLAKRAKHYSLIRSFHHHNSDHGAADHYMLTGYFPGAGFNLNLMPNNHNPAVGSVLSRKFGPRGSVPPYVCLPKMHPSGGPAYLGAAHAPFVIDGDPSAPNFAVADLVPPPVVAADRLDDRKALLAGIDRFHQRAEALANAPAAAVGTFREKAFDLMTSAAAKSAFDVAAEPVKLRDEYGRHSLGQSCLLARRLVEAGVRCVTVDHNNWDTHDGNFTTLKNSLLPQFDAALSGLFRDLADRGILDRTLVVVTGEFGRTPRINKQAGRDHWGPGFTVMVGGGGIQGGRVVGKSDARAERPAADPYGPEDLATTLFTLCGVNPKDEFRTPDGRPVAVAGKGRTIAELI